MPSPGSAPRPRPSRTGPPSTACSTTPTAPGRPAGPGPRTRRCGPHFGDHAYVNYIDPELGGWRAAYYGGNAARLAQIKAARDPGRLFRLPQGI
ncbi:BBE domain-containing protein [Streptosporangium vulgare]|uniref:BBE domain-containing protein n=1 Tax=Streptosporangium vulgare TaxID=46190 RepID=UPI00338B6969